MPENSWFLRYVSRCAGPEGEKQPQHHHASLLEGSFLCMQCSLFSKNDCFHFNQIIVFWTHLSSELPEVLYFVSVLFGKTEIGSFGVF